MPQVTGFVERAWQVEGRNYKGKPLFKALVDGHEIDFFLDNRILNYQNKEVTYEQTEGEYGKKGKLPSPEGDKKPFTGYQGKPRSSDAAFATSYAKDLCVAKIGTPKGIGDIDPTTWTIDSAKRIYEAMKQMEKGE